jgi:hypothetical protein
VIELDCNDQRRRLRSGLGFRRFFHSRILHQRI